MTEKWELAFAVARSISEGVPEATFLALHQKKRTKEARKVLLTVVERFGDNYMMRYTLACYACRLAQLKEAWEWLTKTIDLDQSGNLHMKRE